MVSSISSTSATQATYAPAAKKNLDETISTASPVAATDDGDTAAAPTQSAESAASARLGDQLNAQADASRVQRAVDEASTDSAAATDAETGTEASTETETETGAAAAPARGAPPAGGAPAASSSEASTATDYIAEADTNSDKTVSDEERAAYETKLRQQAEDTAATTTPSSTQADPLEALTAEVRATYGVDEAAEPALNITA